MRVAAAGVPWVMRRVGRSRRSMMAMLLAVAIMRVVAGGRRRGLGRVRRGGSAVMTVRGLV